MPDANSSKPTTDLNLLFGLLALQLDFISKEGLLAAMQTWLLEKQTPLGDVLLRHGALSADRKLLLEALVREHLKQHDNDPQQSLASLSSVDSAKQQLGQLADPDVQASLGPSLSSPVLSISATLTQSPDAGEKSGEIPKSTERFRLLRYHAEGGLGQVWVAEDSELHREVALKVIQPKKAHQSAHQSRFVLEAEITGGLEHPGIVPVYGLGHYADGRPYYAMKFIRGNSLKTAITEFHGRFQESAGFDRAAWNLELRSLLQRFVDVCNTVAYAHNKGVLHRDLKPGNVMIGKYGETLVVDWGLAKAVGERVADPSQPDEATLRPATSDSYETISGSAIGTPAYMPPEQAAGRLTELGPHSDVYSLGATLYHLLTNRPPFDGSARQVLDQVIAGKVTPPHDRSRRIPVGLSAICVKAMHREPSARYTTPRDLAQDIERWLADESITARRDSLVTHTRRWLKRHPALATTLALLALVSLSLMAARIREANRLRAIAATDFVHAEERLAVRDFVEAARLLNQVQGQLKNRSDLADLSARASELSKRVGSLAQADQSVKDFRSFAEAALRLENATDSQSILETLSSYEQALGVFGVFEHDEWATREPFINVAVEIRPGLAEEIDELKFKYFEHQHRRGCRGAMATGLGLQLYQSKAEPIRAFRIQRIIPDTPAARAGLRVGDRVLEVADKNGFEFKDSDALVEAIVGMPETPIELLVHRSGANDNERLTLIRSPEGRLGMAPLQVELFVVGRVRSGSAAEKAGLQMGDLLFDIDWQPAEGVLHVGETGSWNFPYTGLFHRLQAAGKQKHLTV
jgi:serine/threonine protein kinase